MSKKLFVVLALLSIASTVHAAPVPVTVDDFANGTAFEDEIDASVTSTGFSENVSGTISNTRSLELEHLGSARTVGYLVDTSTKSLLMESSARATGRWTLSYYLLVAGGLKHYGTSGNDTLTVDILWADQPFDLSLNLYSGDVTSAAGQTITQNLTETDTGYTASFDMTQFNTVDLSQLSRIKLIVTGKPGGDYEISNIQMTPEPATVGLLAFGGLALLRRRRKKK